MLILLFRWGLLVLFYFLVFFKCPASVNTGVSTTTTLLAIPLENPNPPVYSWRSTATTAAISLGNNDLIVLSLSLGLGITAKCYITVGPALYASSTAVLSPCLMPGGYKNSMLPSRTSCLGGYPVVPFPPKLQATHASSRLNSFFRSHEERTNRFFSPVLFRLMANRRHPH